MAELSARQKKWLVFVVLLLLLTTLTGGAIFSVWAWPKSHTLSIADHYTGYYHGLGWTTEPGFFGRNYYLVEVDEGLNGYWSVDYRGPGYNRYRGFYPDGALKEEGECLVTWNDFGGDPAPDNHDVRSGKYYRPDGTLGSSVVDGTGTQTYWYPDGTQRWELELKDYRRVHLDWWYPNGQRILAEEYVDGKVHGRYQSFYHDGTLKAQGEYAHGDHAGKWVYYFSNGSVKEEGEFDDGEPVGKWISYDEEGNEESVELFTTSESEQVK